MEREEESVAKPPLALVEVAEPIVNVEPMADGGFVVHCARELGPYEDQVGEALRRWARDTPDNTFLAERPGGDSSKPWRRVSFAETRTAVDAISQALLDRGLGLERPLLILSGNGIDHGLLALGAMQVGIPIVPVSAAYSLMSEDLSKVRYIAERCRPGLVYAASGGMFQEALACPELADLEVVVSADAPPDRAAIQFSELAATTPGPAVESAYQEVGPDSIAKILFTSGSTGMPKGVLNNQRMLCSSQQMQEQTWLFLKNKPLVLVDWMPWNHTFGGNHDFNLVLFQGGTLFIDSGKPAPALIEHTVRNLAEISPTLYLNVPMGYSMLLPYLENDAALRANFFKDLDAIFYAGAALPQDLWERLEAVSIRERGDRVWLTSAWGSTETSPLATSAHYPLERAGNIGVPTPGVSIKFAPAGSKLELRVKGPNVMPGYLDDPALTEAAFDEDGYYCMGDAGKLADSDDAAKGILFDGRVAEDFKLTTGTWVTTGSLRIESLAAAAPALQDAVVTGHDRDFVGLLAWPNIVACRQIAGLGDEAGADELIANPAVRQHIAAKLGEHNAAAGGSSNRIARVLLMAEPASIDANEITDKGYINQRATLERRADLVERLHADPVANDVIEI